MHVQTLQNTREGGENTWAQRGKHVGGHEMAWESRRQTSKHACTQPQAGAGRRGQAGSGVQTLSIRVGIKVSWTLSIYLSIYLLMGTRPPNAGETERTKRVHKGVQRASKRLLQRGPKLCLTLVEKAPISS